MEKTLVQLLDEKQKKAEQGPWLPGGGGSEVPFFTRSGHRLLWCWQPSTGKHAYLDMGTDLIISDETAKNWIGW